MDTDDFFRNPETTSKKSLQPYRFIKLGLSVFFLIILSAPWVGYPALQPALFRDGIYNFLCDNKQKPPQHCLKQELRLDLMMTITTSIGHGLLIVAGIVAAKIGSKATCFIGAGLSALGFLLFGLSSDDFPAWMAGYAILGAASAPILIPILGYMLLLFPKHTVFINSLLLASSDASSVLWIFFELINRYGNVKITLIFLCFTIFPIIFFNSVWFIFSGSVSKSPLTASATPRTTTWFPATVSNSILRNVISRVFTFPFLFLLLWEGLYMTTKYYYIINVHDQLNWVFGCSSSLSHCLAESERMTTIFNILLPIGGFIFFFLYVWLMEKGGIKLSVLVLTFSSMALGIFSSLKGGPYWLQFITFACLIFEKSFLFALVPQILVKMYGISEFQVLYGIMAFGGGVINLFNYLLSYLIKDILRYRFLPFNIALNLLCVITSLVLTYFISVWERPNYIK
eukprot:TRINITY_DN9227_c0_g2_i2.p1 TRINITY_DN9227_c0_g2~~TRINITY_DN9227_c0_g2_i2.p1  ORF type:complete len:465 (-),score=20.23 TRINITY_DN9227_c0_g2_i2:11-1378(-)